MASWSVQPKVQSEGVLEHTLSARWLDVLSGGFCSSCFPSAGCPQAGSQKVCILQKTFPTAGTCKRAPKRFWALTNLNPNLFPNKETVFPWPKCWQCLSNGVTVVVEENLSEKRFFWLKQQDLKPFYLNVINKIISELLSMEISLLLDARSILSGAGSFPCSEIALTLDEHLWNTN